MALLSEIYSPLDLRRLRENQLDRLCAEIRERIIEVVSHNGGHLASSLGVVELGVALHYVFQSPVDSIVWDVGNQAYAHKLLTGRRERFDTLRRAGGLSGFCRRDESEHDCFGAGHASTSISAALGIAEAKRLKGEQGKVVAVIGDGGMTGGLAFEALNHAGSLERDLVVILNDNGMFISPHVGGMSSWLSQRLSGPVFNQFRRRIKGVLNNYPRYGEKTLHWIRRMVEGTKAMFTPGILFEGFGFQYVGPVDGHDLGALVTILQNVRHLDGPVLVHVQTVKGKGYAPAEAAPSRFHGVGRFDAASGRFPAKDPQAPPSYTSVFSDALVREAERDDRVVAITAAMPDGTGLSAFAERFPDRFYDVGIAEGHAVTFAAGLACGGRRPVVAIYSTFLQRAYDMLQHDVCLQKLPVVFALDRGGVVGEDGPTHQGLFDLSYLANLPGLTIMAPSDENELPRMLRTALSLPGPAAFRYPRGASVGLEPDGEPEVLEVGKGRIMHTPGAKADLAILTIGTMLYPALRAAEVLTERGVHAIVADARFRKPLDEELIMRLAREGGHILTVEENVLEGGFGQAVGACLQRHGLLVPLHMLGAPDSFISQGDARDIRRQLGLDAGGIVKAALDLAGKARTSLQSA
ncbi:MAG TPA: 1-deoxy-D-xylulose-5-phosphate synthase [Myxococcota bacterium]|nr:1-deoxy-D-xylulose-5-phosphate synthase [Myxococcota bacterium]